jgi:hypothetical protein
MKRFIFGRPPALDCRWSFEAPGDIWRIIPTASGQILGEVRLHQDKRVSFFCLEEKGGATLWEDRRFDEPWWIGIEAVFDGVLILHTYEKPDMPQHRDMIAVDLLTGGDLWKIKDVTYWFVAGSSVYSYRQQFESKAVYEHDIRTGELVRSFDESLPEFSAIRLKAQESFQTGPLTLPAPYAAGEDLMVDGQTERWIPPESLGMGVESLRHDDYLLMSYYEAKVRTRSGRPELDNSLRIVDLTKGTLIHDEILASSVPAPVPDTFFVREGKVISIKDLRSLRAHVLP